MNPRDGELRKIWPLVDRMIDGLISTEELEQLEHALDGNPGLQKSVLDYSQIHVNLFSEIRSKQVVDAFVEGELHAMPAAALARLTSLEAALAPNLEDAEPVKDLASAALEAKSGEKIKNGRWAFGEQYLSVGKSLSLIALGAVLALAGAQLFTRKGKEASHGPATPVAFLTTSSGCAWGSNSSRFGSLGAGVGLGDEIALQEGIAEFRMASGAYISVEGPADFVLTSADSLVLQYGKVTTQVPWSMREFRITAGGCRLTTSEAEFGVCVVGGRLDTHVFAGEVLVVNAQIADGAVADDEETPVKRDLALGDMFTSKTIREGRALTLVSRNGLMKITKVGRSDPSFFASKLNMAGPLPITQDYVNTVIATGPIGYWRFEAVQGGVVKNEIPNGTDLTVAGNVRLTDLSGNHVAELPPGSDAYFFSKEPLDDLTKSDYSFEVWVKPSHIHFGTILGMCPSEPVTMLANAFLLEVQGASRVPWRDNFGHPSSIRFLHRSPPSRSTLVGTSCFSNNPYAVRRWQHVVAVKRGAQMELYVDGKLEGEGEDKTTLEPGQRLMIGRQALSVDNSIQFIGQLDEVAVYPRALTPKEIEAHHKLIDWSQVKKAAIDQKSS